MLPAFGSDLAQGYLDKVSMDDDQERLALFPDVSGYPKVRWTMEKSSRSMDGVKLMMT